MIQRFQANLDISYAAAMMRFIGFIFLAVCVVGSAIALALWFPWEPTIQEEMPLLPGNYQYVLGEGTPEPGVVILQEKDFHSLAALADTVTVYADYWATYVFTVSNVRFQYRPVDLQTESTLFYGYDSRHSFQIQGEMIVWQADRSFLMYTVAVGTILFASGIAYGGLANARNTFRLFPSPPWKLHKA